MSRPYGILISGLKEGRHLINFEIGKDFFEQFENSELREGRLFVNIEMDKRSSHIDLVIRISGDIRMCCDRCLEMYLQPVSCENRLIVKFGKDMENDDPDVISVPIDEHELDLTQHIFEFIYLALPIKRIHPNDLNGNYTCDPEMLEKLSEHIVVEGNNIDPRWDDLKKLITDN